MLRAVALSMLLIGGLILTPAIAQAPADANAAATTPQQGQVSVAQALAAFTAELEAGRLDATGLRRAQDVATAVLQQNPNSIPALLLAGEVLIADRERPDFEQARTLFERVLKVEPSNFRANRGVGKIWMANRYWRQAAAALEQAERVAPQDKISEIQRLLALTYQRMGDSSRATQKVNEAIDADPQSLENLAARADIWGEIVQTEPDKVSDALQAADAYVDLARTNLQNEPWNRQRLVDLNNAYGMKLNVLQALHNSLYEKNLHGQPTDQIGAGKGSEAADVLLEIGRLIGLRAGVQHALAEHDVLMMAERAVQYDPNDVKNLAALAEAFQRTQNRDGAIATCQRILELEPDNQAAREYLEAQHAPLKAEKTTPPATENPAP